ncbi:MAG: type II toxin-antitoxin system VapC family toxin, partial [Desulfococcaceae bacterium]
TWDWREFSKESFELYGSQGDKKATQKRLEILAEIPLLELGPEAFELAQLLIRGKVVPEKGAEDAFHIAIATFYGMDCLLSGNCRHIANARIQLGFLNCPPFARPRH